MLHIIPNFLQIFWAILELIKEELINTQSTTDVTHWMQWVYGYILIRACDILTNGTST